MRSGVAERTRTEHSTGASSGPSSVTQKEWPCIPEHIMHPQTGTRQSSAIPCVGPTVTCSSMSVYKDLTDRALDTVTTRKTDLEAVLTVGLMSVFPGPGRVKTHLSQRTDSSVQR